MSARTAGRQAGGFPTTARPAAANTPPARTGPDAWIRPLHRWMAIVFSVAAIANIVALVLRVSAPWLGLLAVAPLIPMMATGLWMFAQPYRAKRRH